MFFRSTIIVNDPKLINELLSENAASGRPTDNPVIYEFSKGPYGIIAQLIYLKATIHAFKKPLKTHPLFK